MQSRVSTENLNLENPSKNMHNKVPLISDILQKLDYATGWILEQVVGGLSGCQASLFQKKCFNLTLLQQHHTDLMCDLSC